MPDPIVPAAPVPSAHSVVKPAAPVAPVEPVPVPEAPKTPDELAKVKDLLDKRTRELVADRRKYQGQLKDTQPKLQKLAELEKREQMAKLNPPEYLKSIFGDGWYDVVVQSKINGVPPADLIASEMAKMREDFAGQLKTRDDAAKTAQEAQAKASQEQTRRQLQHEAREFYAAKGKDFPLLEQLGNTEAIAATVAQHIESTYFGSEKRDADGRLLSPGRVLTVAEAAEQLENNLIAIAEKAAASEKYRERLSKHLTPPSKAGTIPAPQLPSNGKQLQPDSKLRRTLSNDLTGSADGRPQVMTREERIRRATEAYESLHHKA